jgi:5-methylcytosine-specific restriction protein A
VPERAAIASDSWRAGKETSAARGYGHRWRCYRARYLEKNPLCVMCMSRGRVTSATVVDHKIPHKGDERLFWDETNHQSLCKPCHDSEKARLERGAGQR